MSIAEPPIDNSHATAFPLDTPANWALLRQVPWEMYLQVRDAEENNYMRMTYDGGALEIMSPSGKHAKVSHVISCMIYEWTMLHRIDIETGGDMTFKKETAKRGLEPDQCFWIARVAEVMGKDEIDLNIDPPPDLAIEVEVSRSLIPKLPIYQTLGIPEIWRWRRGKLEILVLFAESGYVTRQSSVSLPGFPLSLAAEFVERRRLESLMTLMRRFRQAISELPKP